MHKLVLLLLAMLSVAAARPAVVAAPLAAPLAAPVAYTGLPVAYSAPGFVTATSSQYYARNYNGVVAAPYVTAAAAPLVASSAYSYAPAYVF